jgi:transcriptional regulator with XRE-family HTH domain
MHKRLSLFDMWDPGRLNQLCAGRGLSAEDLARALGGSKTTVWRWLNGKAEPRYSDAVRLAQFFGVDLRAFSGEPLADAAPAGPGDELTDDERYVLKVIRDLELGGREVVRRLYAQGPQTKPAELPAGEARPAESITVVAVRNRDEQARREAEERKEEERRKEEKEREKRRLGFELDADGHEIGRKGGVEG